MSSILQGTTPVLTITIDTNDFYVSDITALELTFKNNENTTIHGLSDVVLDSTDNTIAYQFTESETLALTPGMFLKYQLRFKFSDGAIIGTKIMKASTDELISKKAMEA